MRILLLIAIVVLGAPLAARAADCARATTQIALDACADRSLQAASAELASVYRAVANRLVSDAPAKSALVSAQRAWTAYRNAECAFRSADSLGGTMHPMLVSECAQRLTVARTEALRSVLRCSRDDALCPGPVSR